MLCGTRMQQQPSNLRCVPGLLRGYAGAAGGTRAVSTVLLGITGRTARVLLGAQLYYTAWVSGKRWTT